MENLIAGAWGCGVFMQDPSTVATLLVSAARNYNIPNIYFAIPDRNSRNGKLAAQVSHIGEVDILPENETGL